jgi:GTP cyclohydrolase IA
MNKRDVSWDEIMERLEPIDKVLNVVYGVPKNGSILCAHLEYARVAKTPEEATVILDDIIDSGATAKDYIEKYDKPFYALFNKNEELFDEWLVFPWEKAHPKQEDTIQQNVTRVLEFIGEDVRRDGILDTPKRVAKMYQEIFKGYNLENKPKPALFKNGKDGLVYDQMIIDSGDFYSQCEHHMVPFFGKYWFAYIPSPNGNIIGLSKVARFVDFHSSKLQIQERLVHDVVEDLWEMACTGAEPPLGMALVMEAEHLCKTMRGAKKKGTMTTIKLKGVFLEKQKVKDEFLSRIR